MAITLTPLSGSGSVKEGDINDKSEPFCYLLEVDDARILLDCGSRDWESDSSHSFKYESTLKDIAPTIDLLLISHSSSKHCGLYAYAYTHFGLKCPAYCSLPVKELARLSTLEDIIGWRNERDINNKVKNEGNEIWCVPTREENRAAWSTVKDVRYHQPQHLYGKLRGVTITAYSSGHTLGGTLWKIRAPSVGTILYAVGLNHMKERHLDGTVLLRGDSAAGGLAVHEQLIRPGLVITDSERGDCINAKRKDRDAALLETINKTLQSNHSLLLPCDPTTRILELLVLLDQHWSYIRDRDHHFKIPLCLISNTGNDMLKFVRGLMEWFGGATAAGDNSKEETERRFREGRGVLDFKTLNIFTSVEAFEAKFPPHVPKLVLAIPMSMSYGASRRLLTTFSNTPGNSIVLTNRGTSGSLARKIFDKWNENQNAHCKWGSGKIGDVIQANWNIQYMLHEKVPLLGEELEQYQALERSNREQEAARKAADSRRRRMMEADAEESEESDNENESDDDNVENTMDVDNTSSMKKVNDESRNNDDDGVQQISYDIYLKGHSTRGATSFFKTAASAAPRFRMFPFTDIRRKVDSYGEAIDTESWLSRGRELERLAAEEDQQHEAKRRKKEEEVDATPPEPPSKYISHDITLNMTCKVIYIDMEGLNDGRAIKNIMPRLNPRKMILVGGTENASKSLINSFEAISAMTKDIYVPKIGQEIKIGEHTHSYTFTLGDSLVRNIHMAPFEDFVVGHASGKMIYHGDSLVPTFEVTDSKEEKEDDEFIGNLPTSLFIGDMKLTALKSKLNSLGIHAEFGGEGVLICWNDNVQSDETEGAVAISKNSKGNLNIQGGLIGDGDIYYTVRDAVYAMHAVIPSPN